MGQIQPNLEQSILMQIGFKWLRPFARGDNNKIVNTLTKVSKIFSRTTGPLSLKHS